MTYLIRTSSRRLDGSEIVRTKPIASAEATVGRGADCDIQLNDLAVSLKHAVLRQIQPRRLEVEAVANQPFEVNGQFTRYAELDLGQPNVVILGSFTLKLAASEDGVGTVIDVARSERHDGDDSEDEVFGLSPPRFGKRAMAWTLLAAILAIGLAWPVFNFVARANDHIHADKQWSIGPLSKSHAFLSNNCQSCHEKALVAIRDETCLSCHQASLRPVEARRVLANARRLGADASPALIWDHAAHDRLAAARPAPRGLGEAFTTVVSRAFNHPNDRCASCHLEHLADKPVKTPAGAANRSATSVPVQANLVTCEDCHANLAQRLPGTPLANAPNWRHHPEFSPQVAQAPVEGAVQTVRISMVQQPIAYTGLLFSHQSHLSAQGGVTRMARGLGFTNTTLDCKSCHRPDRSGKGFEPVSMVRDCSACHSLAYGRAGEAPLILPHGKPEQVAPLLANYFEAQRDRSAAPEAGPGLRSRLISIARNSALAFSRPDPRAQTDATVRAVFGPSGMCGECHVVKQPADKASLAFGIAPVIQTSHYFQWGDFDHSVPAHSRDVAGQPACGNCHKATTTDDSGKVMLPRISQCASCHGATKSRTPLAASADCSECHSYHSPGQSAPKPSLARQAEVGPFGAIRLAANPGFVNVASANAWSP